MENNLENKAKFFAQHLGQRILVISEFDNNLYKVEAYSISIILKGNNSTRLSLKPLSSISDEDAINLMNIIYPKFDKKEILYKKDRFIYFLTKIPIYHISMECEEDKSIQVFDYLRSKGYALPWMGLSVDKLIEYGWIKIAD